MTPKRELPKGHPLKDVVGGLKDAADNAAVRGQPDVRQAVGESFDADSRPVMTFTCLTFILPFIGTPILVAVLIWALEVRWWVAFLIGGAYWLAVSWFLTAMRRMYGLPTRL